MHLQFCNEHSRWGVIEYHEGRVKQEDKAQGPSTSQRFYDKCPFRRTEFFARFECISSTQIVSHHPQAGNYDKL